MHANLYGPEDGPPVLLLHGGGVAGWMWNSLRQNLEPRYRVVVPDLPGHGQSGGEPYLSHSATAMALHDLVMQRVGGPAAVVGFSLGAQLAITLAAQHASAVSRVMVVSAQARPMTFEGLTLGLLGISAPLARMRWFARLQARQLFIPPQLMDQYTTTSAGITKATLRTSVAENLRFTLPANWSRFTGQAVVMVGQRERRLMRDSAAAIHAALPGSILEVVDGCGHGIPLQCPEWFNARVAAWLPQS